MSNFSSTLEKRIFARIAPCTVPWSYLACFSGCPYLARSILRGYAGYCWPKGFVLFASRVDASASHLIICLIVGSSCLTGCLRGRHSKSKRKKALCLRGRLQGGGMGAVCRPLFKPRRSRQSMIVGSPVCKPALGRGGGLAPRGREAPPGRRCLRSNRQDKGCRLRQRSGETRANPRFWNRRSVACAYGRGGVRRARPSEPPIRGGYPFAGFGFLRFSACSFRLAAPASYPRTSFTSRSRTAPPLRRSHRSRTFHP